jgi:3-hydroxyisobutyrate dehydrogenase-like beta-hydroxyacid dehydrogenase
MRSGFIGLGNIGGSIARDLAVSGRDFMVFDTRQEILEEFRSLGAKTVASAREVAEASDVVGICVRTDQQVLDVLQGENGLLAGASPGLLIAVHSTIELDTLEKAKALAEASGVRIVDAPVSRGTEAPSIKGITFMLGGAPDDVDQAAVFCEPAALDIIRTGALGSALRLKIINNVLTYQVAVIMSEVNELVAATGVDSAALWQLISNNGVGSPNMRFAMNRYQKKTDNTANSTLPNAELAAALGEKDLDCALQLAAALDLDLPLLKLGRAEFRKAMFATLG